MAGEPNADWLKGRLSAEDLSRIEAAVKRAEANGALEIVPMIVRRSSAVGQVWIVIMLVLSILGLLGVLAFRDHLFDVEVFVLTAAMFPLAAVLAWPLAGFDALQRVCIPDADEELQVRRRATAEFALARLASTRGRTGLLLFVSVMERRAVVMPDVGLRARMSPEQCEGIVAAMAAELRAGRWAAAFEGAIRASAELTSSMPRPAQAQDELGNAVVIKE